MSGTNYFAFYAISALDVEETALESPPPGATDAYVIESVHVDSRQLEAGETLAVRVYTKLDEAGAYLLAFAATLDEDSGGVITPPLPVTADLKVTFEQSGGTARTIGLAVLREAHSMSVVNESSATVVTGIDSMLATLNGPGVFVVVFDLSGLDDAQTFVGRAFTGMEPLGDRIPAVRKAFAGTGLEYAVLDPLTAALGIELHALIDTGANVDVPWRILKVAA